MTFAIADLYDEHGDRLVIVEPIFRDYGGELTFSGPISTVKAYEGRVLVVDGGGSMRCAMVGDNLVQLGIDNGWAGIVVYGCIRDSAPIGEMALGVKAMNTNPVKSLKKDRGDRDIPVTFGGVTFTPGEVIYADPDGVAVSVENLLSD